MALTIPAGEWARLRAHVEAGYPYEVVGILAGDPATRRVRRVEALVNENAVDPARRYDVDGLVLLRAESRLDAEGLAVLGYYHSHPDHPSRYSDTDRESALPNLSYAIVSVVGGRVASVQSWRLADDRASMAEEPVTLEEPP